ncbi:hypothetical protein [Pseudenterobacter timonensis]|uniref:Uncharacterized protein n=1 Tax=Pseudenterobacter timonensis TaxID=1755099 RepID=A0ABV4A4J4_9ENTR
MSGQETPAAEHSLNKVDKNFKVVLHKSCQCYFRIETLELIFIDESDAAEFEKSMSKLSELIDKHHKASDDYSDALEKYGNAMKDIANKKKLSGYEDAITSTEIALEKRLRIFRQSLVNSTNKRVITL